MNETQFEDWRKNRSVHYKEIESILNKPLHEDFIKRFDKAIQSYYLLEFIQSQNLNKASTTKELKRFIKKSDQLQICWKNINESLPLISSLGLLNSNPYKLQDISDNFFEHLHQVTSLVHTALKVIESNFGIPARGRPIDYALDILILEITDAFRTMGLSLEFSADTDKAKLGDTIYCNFMVKALSIAGISVGSVLSEDETETSGVIKQIRKMLQNRPSM